MNDKLAKQLRSAAGYRNQTATPGTMDFPGIARMYQHPVVRTRQAIRKCYVFMVDKWHKIETKVTAIVTDRFGKGIIDMEWCPPGSVATRYEDVANEDGSTSKKAVEFNTEGFSRPRMAAVPVTKPARLNENEPKGRYRALKRLWRKGLLSTIGQAILAAQMKEVPAT